MKLSQFADGDLEQVLSYALSPLDLIPDFIPILGLLDDMLLLPLGLWASYKLIPAQVRPAAVAQPGQAQVRQVRQPGQAQVRPASVAQRQQLGATSKSSTKRQQRCFSVERSRTSESVLLCC
jgi:uncharacterized membrane protein YkvA (DUF1232 family)